MTYGIVIGILILALLATLIAVLVEKPADPAPVEEQPEPLTANPAAAYALTEQMQPEPFPAQVTPSAPVVVADDIDRFEPAEAVMVVATQELLLDDPRTDESQMYESSEPMVDDPRLWNFDPETGEPIIHPEVDMTPLVATDYWGESQENQLREPNPPAQFDEPPASLDETETFEGVPQNLRPYEPGTAELFAIPPLDAQSFESDVQAGDPEIIPVAPGAWETPSIQPATANDPSTKADVHSEPELEDIDANVNVSYAQPDADETMPFDPIAPDAVTEQVIDAAPAEFVKNDEPPVVEDVLSEPGEFQSLTREAAANEQDEQVDLSGTPVEKFDPANSTGDAPSSPAELETTDDVSLDGFAESIESDSLQESPEVFDSAFDTANDVPQDDFDTTPDADRQPESPEASDPSPSTEPENAPTHDDFPGTVVDDQVTEKEAPDENGSNESPEGSDSDPGAVRF